MYKHIASAGRPKAIPLSTFCSNASERNGRGNNFRSSKNCQLALAAPFQCCYLRLLFYLYRGSGIRLRWFEYFHFYFFLIFFDINFFLVFYTLRLFINNVMHFIQPYSPLLLYERSFSHTHSHSAPESRSCSYNWISAATREWVDRHTYLHCVYIQAHIHVCMRYWIMCGAASIAEQRSFFIDAEIFVIWIMFK